MFLTGAIALSLLLAIAISLVVQLVWIEHAPRGWQDERGFHLGEEPYPPASAPGSEAARRPSALPHS